jgi:signal transduction histidine kinase
MQDATGMHEHFVQFYEKDDFLLDEVSDFIGAGLQAGQAGIVIATQPHRDDLERRLQARRASSGAAFHPDQYIALDAAGTLSKFMVDGWPDEQRFADVLGNVIGRAAQNGSRSVRAFGEMVALLWAEGKHDAAVRLEELWNDLARTQCFSLLCAYPIDGFHHQEHGAPFLHICKAHSHVRPAESFLETAAPAELRRQVALLQQKAAALETEVTKRRQLEAELQQQLEQLAEVDRRKDEFLAMLGHELRNPLAAIVTATELMRVSSDNPAYVARSREIVARQSALMSRLIDDLLDVSRINRGKIELRTETVLLGAIVERAIELVRPLIDERGHRLTVDLPAEPVSLLGDAARLGQVLANLLHNAAKYTDAGGNIALSAHQDGTDLRLCVRDNGMGMTPEFCERVFEPFVQAPGSLERARGGLGIGLTLVRALVDLHGGSIAAASDGPGRGSEFVVRLPLRQPAAVEPQESAPTHVAFA